MMDNQNKQSQGEKFFTHGARIVRLKDWLDWATGCKTIGEQWTVVLPMIQRGSVWKPHQVIDLWDTLLRGMPFGGLMASHIPASAEGSKVRFFRPLDRTLVTLPPSGGLSLVDGQQRTLAMLLAWPGAGELMHRRLWVDFGEADKFDHILRLYVTTESHPLGYLRGGNSGEVIGRLSLAERRRAAATYADRMDAVHCLEHVASKRQVFLHDEDIAPWHSTLALDLRKLIQIQRGESLALSTYVQQQMTIIQQKLTERIKLVNGDQPPFIDYDSSLREGIINHLTRRLDAISKISESDLGSRINALETGLKRLSLQYFPVIEVPDEMMNAEMDDDNKDKDPPLAILFKRIGTGGTDLKTADYVFSVIKHLNPDCHSLVEEQLGHAQVAAIFTPTALVMTAVRLTAARLGMADYAKLEKPQFTRLMHRNWKSQEGDESTPTFLQEFNRQIATDGNFVKDLRAVLEAIGYRQLGEEADLDTLDVGLPKHALSLVRIPVLEVILFWLQRQTDSREITLQTNRHRLVRFILCWHLTVLDAAKASTVCFKKISAEAPNSVQIFPERMLLEVLVAQKLALPMSSPTELRQMEGLTHSSATVDGLRGGWRRFEVSTEGVDDKERDRLLQAATLYERWWNLRGGYSHALLLWLQRDYIFRRFEATPAQPGLGDDTPYDFDHICPQSHWNYWTGKSKGNRLIDFPAEKEPGVNKQGHSRLGNAIGNVRVWDSSENRGDGDAPPSVKLKLVPITQSDETPTQSCIAKDSKAILRDSAIEDGASVGFDDEKLAWNECNPVDKNPMYWTKPRALAFQKAIELRTFNLYQRFYVDLRISELTIKIFEIS